MLKVEAKVNRCTEGVERYFDRELTVSDYLMRSPVYAPDSELNAWDLVARFGQDSLSHCCEMKIPPAAND
jgi:hypothetical protein